eukprot:1379048-Karenia_brevis.AAC.1
MFSGWLSSFTRSYAAYHLQSLNSCQYGLHYPVASPVFGCPPARPNVYSDGGCTAPTIPMFSLITAGIWWSGRKDDEHTTFTAGEREFTLGHFSSAGLDMMASAGGLYGSSARAELLGVVIASFGPSPFCLALDNLA